MPTLLIQRGKGGKDYQEVGPEFPLATEIVQDKNNRLSDLLVTSRVYQTDLREIPGIGTAAAYAAGEAFGTKFSIPVPVQGTISRIAFLDLDDEGLRKDFVLFSRDFTATADNAAFNLSDGDLAYCLGVLSVDNFFNWGANQLGQVYPAFDYIAPDGLLYCQIVTQGADNIAAGAIPKFFLTVV